MTFAFEENVARYIPKKVLKHITNCYKDSDGYWAICEKGWHFDNTGCHTAHGETVAEFKEDVWRVIPVENDWD